MTTDTPKRLSDDEVAAQFLALEVFLGNVDGHDMTDWSTDEHGEMRGVDEGTIDAGEAVEAMNALRAHIAALTTPPSQGKVERAREKDVCDNYEPGVTSYYRRCAHCGWPQSDHITRKLPDGTRSGKIVGGFRTAKDARRAFERTRKSKQPSDTGSKS